MPASDGPRSIVLGNLGCEEEWAAAEAGGGTRPRSLSAAARASAAAAGSLLRVFASADDLLWTVELVDPGRLPPVPGIQEPRWVAGSWRRLSSGGRGGGVLAWGETAPVEALRERWGSGSRVAEGESPGLAGSLWSLPRAAATIAARANDRAIALELARREGWALPGAALVTSAAELDRRVRLLEREHPAGSGGGWVAKAPFAAAGRHRLVAHSAGELGRSEVARHGEGLLRRFGRLVVEPWLPRVADFGWTALVDGSGVRPISCHRLEVDGRGAFLGLEMGPGGGPPAGITEPERMAAEQAVRVVGGALADIGYRGPFGIDSFRWRTAEGGTRFHPVCEINARMTFGLVGRALAERVLGMDGLARAGAVALRFGRSLPRLEVDAGIGATVGGAHRVVPLIASAEAGPGPAAWLEIAATGVGGRARGRRSGVVRKSTRGDRT